MILIYISQKTTNIKNSLPSRVFGLRRVIFSAFGIFIWIYAFDFYSNWLHRCCAVYRIELINDICKNLAVCQIFGSNLSTVTPKSNTTQTNCQLAIQQQICIYIRMYIQSIAAAGATRWFNFQHSSVNGL